MIVCPICGAQNEDKSRFCLSCGGQLGSTQAAPAGQPAASQAQNGWYDAANARAQARAEGTGTYAQTNPAQANQAYVNQGGYAGQGGYASQGGYQQGYTQGGYAQGGYTGQGGWQPTPPQPHAPRGCLAQAASDITHIPGMLGRVAQVALVPAAIALIPIVGWVMGPILGVCATGFAVEWGRELSRGRGFDTGGKLFRSSLFSLGFFSNAMMALLQLLSWIPLLIVWLFAAGGIAGILTNLMYGSYYYGSYGSSATGVALGAGLLGTLAWLLSVALSTFLGMFADAAVMHLGVTGHVESAFSIRGIWDAYKRNLGKLFCASVLPGLVVGAVSGLVLMLVWLVCGGLSWMSMSALSGSAVGVGAGAIIGLIITVFVVMFAMGLTSVLKMRAVGYWAARYAPEWQSEQGAA